MDFPIISIEQLKINYANSSIIIASLSYYDEILELLSQNGLKDNVIGKSNTAYLYYLYNDYWNIINEKFSLFTKVYDNLSDQHSKKTFIERIKYCLTGNEKYLLPYKCNNVQYFDEEIISLKSEEIFIDGGAFTGDTIESFLKQVDGNFKKIYSFEPEKSKNEEFLKRLAGIKNIRLLPYGLWNKKELVSFMSNNSAASKIEKNGNSSIEVTSIDEFLQGKEVTFIKMDIEGAELEALKGAENTIKRYKPKLAICVYHKPMDIVNIPIYLKSIVPEYNIYLRHYSYGPLDTVCYAVYE
ncbi:FkbM family methyltransferase [Clostridium caseinilyticum]|uniref:FkbM family methyltransferase n=1 Tax=Clostridium caseinilyticum TaxID=3350403 RepID=UPI0013D20E0E